MITRPVDRSDIDSLKKFIHNSPQVHKHLDWFTPTDWIDTPPFYVVEQEGQIIAALACPVVPKEVGWIRLFGVSNHDHSQELWQELWHPVREIRDPNNSTIAVITPHKWFQEILKNNGFASEILVVTLQWESNTKPPQPNHGKVRIRRMTREDVSAVSEVDHQAFELMWRNSKSSLEKALTLSAYATVAVESNIIVGYQISTASSSGAHLARLAVLPTCQSCGIGYALVRDLLAKFIYWGSMRVTVNTQSDNAVSLAIYKKAGFHLIEGTFPVYQTKL